MIAPEEIRTRLAGTFPGAEIQVVDLTGTRDHYEVTIVTEVFKDKTLVERHRMAYAPFQDVIGGDLHALSLKTLAPGE